MISNFEEERFDSREERDKRWEELMVVKPHVVRGTTSDFIEKEGTEEVRKYGQISWWIRYPRLVL